MFFEPIFLFHSSQVGYDRATEVKRRLLGAYYDLRTVGIVERFPSVGLSEGFHQGGNVAVIALKALHDGFQLFCLDKRLVALHVDYDVGRTAALDVGFIASVGAAAVMGAGHDCATAKTFYTLKDALVVSGY